MATASFLNDKFILNAKASKKVISYLENPDKVPTSSVVNANDFKDIINYNRKNEEKALIRLLSHYKK